MKEVTLTFTLLVDEDELSDEWDDFQDSLYVHTSGEYEDVICQQRMEDMNVQGGRR